MLRFFWFFALGVAILAVGIAAAPQIRAVLAWILAFLILLMIGDLVLSGVRRLLRRPRP